LNHRFLGSVLLLSPGLSWANGFELSSRVWLSSGETEWSHCASFSCGGGFGVVNNGDQTIVYTLGDPTSKLNYSGIKANTLELVGTQNLADGWRWQGTWGSGSGDGGSIRDQDWLTLYRYGTYTFSDTTSEIRDTRVGHVSLDVGKTHDTGTVRITPFVGFMRYQERTSAYGIQHLRNDFSLSYPNLPNNVKVLVNDITWTGIRLGSEFEWNLSSQSSLLVNAAYVARAKGKNKDSHVLRTDRDDLGPTPNILSEGTGDGWMVDVMARYGYTKQLSFELGYRWWAFTADEGTTRFGPEFAQSFPNRSLFSRRSGVLMGLSYRF